MVEFSTQQLNQLQTLLSPVTSKLLSLDSKLSDVDRQQGSLWELSVRQSVRTQFGHSFAKEFAVVSLQHLAKLICRSTGWPYGTDSLDICRVAEKLARKLLSQRVAEALLRSVFEALLRLASSQDTFAEIGTQLQADPWFDEAGQLDISAVGRSLSTFAGEEKKQFRNKLQKMHRPLCIESEEGTAWTAPYSHPYHRWSPLMETVCTERVAHMLTCRSAGVMLALYAAQPSMYGPQSSTSFKDLTQGLPFLQLQVDVQGKVTMINDSVTVEVGEIKRNFKQYREAKHQLVQRAKLLQWAITAVVDHPLEFVLIGHLFIPRAKPDENIPDNEMAEDVSIFTHQL